MMSTMPSSSSPDRPPSSAAAPKPVRPAGPRVPRGVHPKVHELATALLVARERLPYATAEARLLDGLQRWVKWEASSPAQGVALAPVGPRWADLLVAVAAVARLCSDETRGLLAPWSTAAATATPGVGVSPSAGAGFATYGGAT